MSTSIRLLNPRLKLVKPQLSPTDVGSQFMGLREKVDDPSYPIEHRNLWAALLDRDVPRVKEALTALRALAAKESGTRQPEPARGGPPLAGGFE